MFKPLSLSFFANPGVSTRCVPLVARMVMNLSLCATADYFRHVFPLKGFAA